MLLFVLGDINLDRFEAKHGRPGYLAGTAAY